MQELYILINLIYHLELRISSLFKNWESNNPSSSRLMWDKNNLTYAENQNLKFNRKQKNITAPKQVQSSLI